MASAVVLLLPIVSVRLGRAGRVQGANREVEPVQVERPACRLRSCPTSCWYRRARNCWSRVERAGSRFVPPLQLLLLVRIRVPESALHKRAAAGDHAVDGEVRAGRGRKTPPAPVPSVIVRLAATCGLSLTPESSRWRLSAAIGVEQGAAVVQNDRVAGSAKHSVAGQTEDAVGVQPGGVAVAVDQMRAREAVGDVAQGEL